ncbi:MAG: methyltransferase domain-containing protein, partial [Archaeoglobaceae archaeon]
MRFHGKPDDLKSERRKKILPVDVFEREVLGRLKFRRSAIDYGAGVGYFTLPLAKNFEEVYAVEANEEMAELLREELLKAYVNNV